VVQDKAEWEQQGRRDDLLLPAGFQLERARSLLADPGDIAIDDIYEFIELSSARDEARMAEIRAAQARAARYQRITRWAITAMGAVIITLTITLATLIARGVIL
jgi:hypothetical protein